MKNIWTISQRELQSYFSTPIAYTVAAGILFVVGFIFSLNIIGLSERPGGGVPGMEMISGVISFLFVFTIPAITMRLISDETSQGTIEILMTAPVHDWEIVIGKWLGASLYIASVLALTVIYPLMLNNMVDPGIDQGMVMSGYLALMLSSSALIAIGVMVSTFFTNLIASYMVSMGAFLVMWFLMGAPAQFATGRTATLLRYIDFQGHYRGLSQGVIAVGDLVYFVSLIALFLMVSAVTLEYRRWR